MVRLQEELNYFAVMGLSPSATEAEIRKAYRKLSLALHPDKNLDIDPEVASARFHEMQLAYEILMDPAARLAAVERNKTEVAKKERRGAYDGKRKEMAEELERREEEERMKRYKGVQDEQKRRATLEKLREEGRKLREEKEAKAVEADEKAAQEQANASQNKADEHDISMDHLSSSTRQPELGPLDLTVRLRFPASQFAQLTTSETASLSGDAALDTPLARGLEVRFGKLNSLMWKAPKAERKPSKEATAHATFKTLDSAFAAVKKGSQLRAGGVGYASVLEDVWIGWAAASRSAGSGQDDLRNGEPKRISWLREQGRLSSSADGGSKEVPIESNTSHTLPPENNILERMKNQADKSSSLNSLKNENTAFPSFSFSASPKRPVTQTGTTNSIPTKGDFESSILQKMREAERRRMEDAIRQVEEQPMYN
jgi:DnaJ family protein C protein 17